MKDIKEVSKKMTVYKILALIGEAGAGKDTLLQAALEKDPELFEIISCTTRPPREGEVHGKNYFFCSNTEFQRKLKRDLFIESTAFNGWFYGTSKEDLSKLRINIGVFNPEGITKLSKRKDIDLRVVRLRASDEVRRERQLSRESAPNLEEIERRFAADKKDFSFLPFDYITINNETPQDLIDNAEKISRWAKLWKNQDKNK